jgi:hypothetical protein
MVLINLDQKPSISETASVSDIRQQQNNMNGIGHLLKIDAAGHARKFYHS